MRVWGHARPENVRYSEIPSEAILGHEQSRSSYMACGVLYPIFDCPLHAQPADFEFPQEKILRLAEQQVG